jgi:hypothetical protein
MSLATFWIEDAFISVPHFPGFTAGPPSTGMNLPKSIASLMQK